MIYIDETILLICIGTMIVGGMTGVVGCSLFLQRKSLFGDTIAHATLPGIAGMYCITLEKNTALLLIAGLCSALMTAYCIQLIQQHTLLKKDSILGIMLTACFGLGTMLLSKIQSIPHANQAGITKYLLGNPVTMLWSDIIMMSIASLGVLCCIALYIRPYNIILFDPVYANTIGISQTKISWIMLTTTTIIIVLGLQTVGIILISALLINPPAAAYQWTKNYNYMLFLSAFFGLISTLIGTLISNYNYSLTTGPMIVIISTAITFLSVLCSPTGILTKYFADYQQKQTLNTLTLLSRFLLFNEGIKNPFHAHDINTLKALGKPISNYDLMNLEKQGYIVSPKKSYWQLTNKGLNFLLLHTKVK